MQIVIDIPEKLYNRMKTYQGLDDTYFAVKHGTPLPKRHGRLIDADALECEPYLVSKGNGMYEEVKGYFHIDDAPTIIEATEGRE